MVTKMVDKMVHGNKMAVMAPPLSNSAKVCIKSINVTRQIHEGKHSNWS